MTLAATARVKQKRARAGNPFSLQKYMWSPQVRGELKTDPPTSAVLLTVVWLREVSVACRIGHYSDLETDVLQL